MEEVDLLRGDEWEEAVSGDVEVGGIDVAGDDVVEASAELEGYLARSGGYILGGGEVAAVGSVVRIYGFVEGGRVGGTRCKVVDPVVFIVVGAFKEVGAVFGGGILRGRHW